MQCTVSCDSVSTVSCDSVSAVYSVFFFINIYCSMPHYRVILHALRHLILNLQESFTAELPSSENKLYYNIASSI